MNGQMESLDALLAGLRAVGEQTRLRIFALCARGELSVSELTQILGQSQPRVSRHLKLMVDAGLLDRLPEGAQVYFRLTDTGSSEAARLAHALVELIPPGDAVIERDHSGLEQVWASRAARAKEYFQTVADDWDSIRSLYVPNERVEARLLELVGDGPIEDLLDIGTGTGRILELLSPRIRRGVGIDSSPGMLNVARSNIERSGLGKVHVRQGDMYRLPVADASVDLAVLHMVLHYSDDAESVIREAHRVLRPGGRLIIIDFATHTLEALRTEHNHHRLGFTDADIERFCAAAGFDSTVDVDQLAGDPLTVRFWQAHVGEEVPMLRPLRSA